MRQRFRSGVFPVLVLLLTLSTAFAAPWTSIPKELSAQSMSNQALSGYILVDPEASVVLEAQAEAEPISSTTQAALLVNAFLTMSGDLNANAVVGEGLRALPSRDRKLRVGTTCGRMDLLHAMLMTGAGDAALALALSDGEDEKGFVQRMNDQVAEWGLSNTVFANATGRADPMQKTTLEDLSVIAAHAMGHPGIREILMKAEYTMTDDIGYGVKLTRAREEWEPRVLMGLGNSGESLIYLQYAMDGTRPLLLVASGTGTDIPAQIAAAKSLIAHGLDAYQRIDLWDLAQKSDELTLHLGDADVPAFPTEQDVPVLCLVSSRSLAENRISIVPREKTIEAFNPTTYYADADVMLGSMQLGTIRLYARIQEVITPEPARSTPVPTVDAVAANARPDGDRASGRGDMPMLLIWIGIAAVGALAMNGMAWLIRRSA